MGGTNRSWPRRHPRLGAIVGAAAALVVAAGPARAGLIGVATGLGWILWRLPRLERQLFRRSRVRSGMPLKPEVWALGELRPPAGAGERAEAHRAYAKALHAVTAAYLAECEREVQR